MANAQLAQFLAHKGVAYSVSGSTYTLTDTNILGTKLAEIARAATQWGYKVEKISTAVKISPRLQGV